MFPPPSAVCKTSHCRRMLASSWHKYEMMRGCALPPPPQYDAHHSGNRNGARKIWWKILGFIPNTTCATTCQAAKQHCASKLCPKSSLQRANEHPAGHDWSSYWQKETGQRPCCELSYQLWSSETLAWPSTNSYRQMPRLHKSATVEFPCTGAT